MYILIIVSTVLESNQNWYDQFPVPARCVFETTAGNVVGSISGFYLARTLGETTLAVAITIIPLFPSISLPVENLLQRLIGPLQKRLKAKLERLKKRYKYANIVIKVQRVIFSMTMISMGVNVYYFTQGVLYLISDQAIGNSYIDSSDAGSQSTWGFGQLVPMFLISLPILTALEIYYGTIALHKHPLVPLYMLRCLHRRDKGIYRSQRIQTSSKRF